tara:strand:+ start:1803 stop:1925 length:123 start_codon:yes stop_codon:yes gene_type:complete
MPRVTSLLDAPMSQAVIEQSVVAGQTVERIAATVAAEFEL